MKQISNSVLLLIFLSWFENFLKLKKKNASRLPQPRKLKTYFQLKYEYSFLLCQVFHFLMFKIFHIDVFTPTTVSANWPVSKWEVCNRRSPSWHRLNWNLEKPLGIGSLCFFLKCLLNEVPVVYRMSGHIWHVYGSAIMVSSCVFACIRNCFFHRNSLPHSSHFKDGAEWTAAWALSSASPAKALPHSLHLNSQVFASCLRAICFLRSLSVLRMTLHNGHCLEDRCFSQCSLRIRIS